MPGLIPVKVEQQDVNAIIETPLPIRSSRLAIRTQNGKLLELSFVSNNTPLKSASDKYSKQVVSQINSYFADPAFQFDLDLELVGTEYQKKVWKELQTCASGTVWSYGALAKRIKSAPRAVGGACRSNPVPIVVPCHRVVAAQGPGGYAGKTTGMYMTIKKWLLDHESVC